MQGKQVLLFSFLLVIVGTLFACNAEEAERPIPQTTAAITVTPSPTHTVTAALTSQIDQYMQNKNPSFSGTILVAQKNEDPIMLSYGLADREHEVPNTSQTKYAIGSIGKSFTAMAIMILEERGLLAVEDSICQYILDCPDAWQPVSMHHLLTHTSGIPDYFELAIQGEIVGEPCIEYTTDEVIALFRDFPLEFQPGNRYKYSNSGYFLLGMVIEDVTDASYESFIQENILQPLDMSETGYNHAHEIVKNRASGYSLDVLELINAQCVHVSIEFAAGGLYSTVEDLYKWDQALYTDQLVSKKTLDKIFTSVVDTNGGDRQYGYGWLILQASGHQIIEHGGGTSGFRSYLVRYPDDQVTIIVLSNFDFLDPFLISRELADVVFDE